ncbi:MAG: hypoxanthine-guanine phosphoribosyltransferase [Gammaproteobacteria bacterium]|nr:hypoxanthine-guanine phosphoribosyltransferase [Gammaproteobacteria bacterium]
MKRRELSGTPDDVLDARRRAELVVDAGDVTLAIDRTAVRVTLRLRDANPLVLCVMNGGLVYCGRLLARLHFPLELAYAHLGRYGDFTRGGSLNWVAKPAHDVAGRALLVVDDVLDDGDTLKAVCAWARAEGAARVWTTVLVRKKTPRNEAIDIDFAALECPDRYLFGCGMDYRGYWRNLPAIHALPKDLERQR